METDKKQITWVAGVVTVLGVIFSLFHLYTAGVQELPAMQQRLVHLTLGLMMAFLIFPWCQGKENGKMRIADVVLAIIGLIVGGYLIINYEAITFRLGAATELDIIMGAILVALVLEGTRRVMGWPLPTIAVLALLYAFFGDRMPDALAHSGFDADRVVSHLSLTTEGIFGIPLGASATVVVIFILFTSFLNATGAGQYFVDLVMSKFGKTRGGSAKAAVVGSALMGMLTGSVVANVMGIGTFTIPLMKENGYNARVAAAVEAVSSTGGQIMPPVMGAAAYIIAEVLRLPFVDIIMAAIIPAVLYYLAEFIFVDLEAQKNGLAGFSDERIAEYRERAKGKSYRVLPIIVLVGLMVVLEWLPTKAAFYSIVLALLIAIIQKENRINWSKLLNVLTSGARGTLEVIMATACAGIIIGSLSLTGLGIQMSSMLVNLAGGSLILLLLLTMVVSIILGMGLTTTACYVILAVLVAPSLVKMGVNPLAAHFYVFYFGMYSFITPPVALGAYAAASLSGADPFATGFTAFKIALPGFLIPFLFIYYPALLGIGALLDVAIVVITACIGVFFMCTSTVGFFRKDLVTWERAIMLVAGLMLIHPSYIASVIGIVLGVAMLILRCRPSKDAQAC
ncbi:MAG: TRAP transporter permease [Sporomusaceae bacterium]|nr:TRAP transporter permease [Sporomusaceae bacterium]